MSDKTNVKLGPDALGKVSGTKKGKPEKYNTAIGYQSMYENKKGFQNTAVGASSLYKNETSSNNTAIGFNSLINSKGTVIDEKMKGNNTALGAKTGETLTEGISNVLIGKEADVSDKNAINRIVIGANATGNDNHSVTLGDKRITQVNMSDSKKASINCGQINVYNKNGKKAYSLPNVDGQAKQVLKTDGKGTVTWKADSEGSGGGASTFLDLTDTPSEFTASKFVKVNDSGDALEFVSSSGSGGGATDINGLEDGKTTYDSKITSNAEGEITICGVLRSFINNFIY